MINANPGLIIPQMAVYHKKYHIIIYYHDLEATSIIHKPWFNPGVDINHWDDPISIGSPG
jgi:hypothetical protein